MSTALHMCPKGHGVMSERAPGTKEQAWCGTWFECTHYEHGHKCQTSTLIMSPEMAAQYAAAGVGVAEVSA